MFFETRQARTDLMPPTRQTGVRFKLSGIFRVFFSQRSSGFSSSGFPLKGFSAPQS